MVFKSNSSFLHLFIVGCAFVVSSCNKMSEEPVDVVMDIVANPLLETVYSSNGETLSFSYVFNPKKSTQGLKIDRLEFYMNNKKVTENLNKDSIIISYLLEGKTIGKNPTRLTVTATDGKIEVLRHYLMNINVLESKPMYGYCIDTPLFWNKGQEVSVGVSEIEKANIHLIVKSMQLYVDSYEIFSVKESSSLSTMHTVIESEGGHVVKAVIAYTDPDAIVSDTLYIEKPIIIQ